MMTPRQVSMGNKVYKLHLKHESEKTTLNISPDLSLGELRGKIRSQFNLPPNNTFLLFCNGKLVTTEDHKTIKQAKLLNGSKILVSRAPSERSKTSSTPSLGKDREVCNGAIKGAEKKLEEIELNFAKLEERLELFEQEIGGAGDNSTMMEDKELRKLNQEASSLGEQLMKLLEQLDQVQLGDQEKELRAVRKKIATRLNTALDRSDSIKESLKRGN